MIPLINNQSPVPLYNGEPVQLGSTAAHIAKAPAIQKMRKPIGVLVIGASTPGQIATALAAKTFTNVKVINGCTGGQDINDWLNTAGPAWVNMDSAIRTARYNSDQIQAIIMCHDDLRSQDTGLDAAQALADKMEDLVVKLKTKFKNLKHVELFSRLCEYQIADPKFATPSGYENGFANKFLVKKAISMGGTISGVYISDAAGYLWSDGENRRSDGFQFRFDWMKPADVHLNTQKGGDEYLADWIATRMTAHFGTWFY